MPPIRSNNTTPGSQNDVTRRIPRPPNAFFLFRKDYNDGDLIALSFVIPEHRQLPGVSVHQWNVSTITSAAWRSMTKAEKQRWYRKQEEAKREHERRYPGYKYRPVSKKTRRKRQTKRNKQTENSGENHNDDGNEDAGSPPESTSPVDHHDGPGYSDPPTSLLAAPPPYAPTDAYHSNSDYYATSSTSNSSSHPSEFPNSSHHEIAGFHPSPTSCSVKPNPNTRAYSPQLYNDRANYFEQSNFAGPSAVAYNNYSAEYPTGPQNVPFDVPEIRI
ncbi:rox1p [Moniliophthora roreri MCA 2997]|uniref:Rox1p n=2 Tax=Moniliophthora roreri TaxID=221103 RepID=V2WN57_MONRO|nr:rox1p [Moniliophthora roreri MCA 2997]KAI3618049.1 rox1p [Moniliophthora roreri]